VDRRNEYRPGNYSRGEEYYIRINELFSLDAWHGPRSAYRQQEFERRQRELERKRLALEAQMATLRAQFEAEEDELKLLVAREKSTVNTEQQSKASMARSRKADEPAEGSGTRPHRTSPQGARK
jgi:cell division protein FtsB